MASTADIQEFCEDFVAREQSPQEATADEGGTARIPFPIDDVNDLEKLLGIKSRKMKHDVKLSEALAILIEKLQPLVEENILQSPVGLPGKLLYLETIKNGRGFTSVSYLFNIKAEDINMLDNKISPNEFQVSNNEDILFNASVFRMSLQNALEAAIDNLDLPKGLQHAGFANPIFSGIRQLGATSAFLLNWQEEELVAINVQVSLIMPQDEVKERLKYVCEKMIALRKDNDETAFDLARKIHLVPKEPNAKCWVLSTCQLEADVLKQIYGGSPVKTILTYQHGLFNFFDEKAHQVAMNDCLLSEEAEISRQLLEILECYQKEKTNDFRMDIIKVMTYAHIFLAPDKRGLYCELPKREVSITTSAFKNLVLAKAATIPGSFKPLVSGDIIRKLICAVMDDIFENKSNTVKNFFLENSHLPLWSECIVGKGYKQKYIPVARKQCLVIANSLRLKLKFQDQTPFAQRYNVEEPTVTQQDLILRDYQSDLLQRALSSENCIIELPRRTGKGHLAVKLTEINLGPEKKVAHLNPTLQGIWNRWKLYKKYLPQYKSIGIHMNLNSEVPFGKLIEEYDIIITTPHLLHQKITIEANASLPAFNTILIDDCASTNNNYLLLKHYVSEKLSDCEIMPKVIGSCDFLGNIKAKSIEKVQKHVLKICALLDAKAILQPSEEHKPELLTYLRFTTEESISVLPKTTTVDFKNAILQLEERSKSEFLKDCCTNVQRVLLKPPAGPLVSHRQAWVSNIKKVAKEVSDSRNMLKLESFLHIYMYLMNSDALEISEIVSTNRAIDFITAQLEKKSKDEKNAHELAVDVLYSDYMSDSDRYTDGPSAILERLVSILKSSKSQKVILSCRTGKLMDFLYNWFKEEYECSSIQIARYMGSANRESHTEMLKVLERFENGEIQLLFAHISNDLKLDGIADLIIQLKENEILLQRICEQGKSVSISDRETRPNEDRISLANAAIHEIKQKQRTPSIYLRELRALQKNLLAN